MKFLDTIRGSVFVCECFLNVEEEHARRVTLFLKYGSGRQVPGAVADYACRA